MIFRAVLPALMLAACGPATEPESMEATVDATGKPPAGLEQAAAEARADLARRLEIDAATPVVRDARWVVWRDGAIGCPEPDMFYTQALVQGYRILLEHDGRVYHYHGARGRSPFYCPARRAQDPLRDESAEM